MQESKIQINTAKDRLNFALHFGINAAMLGAAVICSHPIAIAGALVSAINFSQRVPHAGQITGMHLVLRDAAAKIGKDSPLQRAANEIAGRFGLKKTPKIYVLTRGSYTSGATAQVWPCGDVFMSAALVAQTNLEQQKGVIAHEFGHWLAGHLIQERIIHFTGGAARDVLILGAAIRTLQYITESQSLPASCLTLAAAGGAWLINEGIKRNFFRLTEYHADRLGAQATSPETMEDMLIHVRKIDVDYHGEAAEQAHDKESWGRHPPIFSRCAALRTLTHT